MTRLIHQVRWRILTGLALAVLLVLGCRERPTTVRGSVTLDGRPLTIGAGMRGSVVFQPTMASGNTLTGLIDKNGHYELSLGGNQTVTPSVYWVTVSATELVPATDDRPSSGKLVTPAKYASATDSGFRIEVVPGENEVNLPLFSDSIPAETEDDATNGTSQPSGSNSASEETDAAQELTPQDASSNTR